MSSLLLLLLWVSSHSAAHTAAPSILGTWRLKAVHMVVQQPYSTQPYGVDAHITFGTSADTFTKDGRWMQRQNGNVWKNGTYWLRKGRVAVYDGEAHYRYQVRALTATQLVLVAKKTQWNGVHIQVIETFVR